MDFNTGGGSGRPEDQPLYGGETRRPTGGPAPGPVGGSGVEFNVQDPVNSFISTVRSLILSPVGFYRGITKRGDFVNPLLFAAICGLISGILGGIVGFLFSLALVGDPDFGVAGAFGNLILGIVLAPIITLVLVFIAAGIFHLLVLLLVRPSNAGFEATTRVVSYAFVYQLVSWIPVIGIVAAVWGIVLSIFGIREVHGTTTGKAALVVLIPVAILLLIGILLTVVLGALLFTLLQQ